MGCGSGSLQRVHSRSTGAEFKFHNSENCLGCPVGVSMVPFPMDETSDQIFTQGGRDPEEGHLLPGRERRGCREAAGGWGHFTTLQPSGPVFLQVPNVNRPPCTVCV